MSTKPIHPPPSLPSSPLSKRTRQSSNPNPFDEDTAMDTTPDVSTLSHSQLGALDHDIHFAHQHLPFPSFSNGNTNTTTVSANGPQNSPETVNLILQEDRLLATSPLQVARLSEKAKVPTRGSKLAAGYDLYAAATTSIPAHSRALVPTDLAIAVPPGTYGRVAPRSGLAVKKGLTTGAGVIDADYRGHVMVLLFNLGNEDVEVEEGERCAQLVLERCVGADVVDVTAGGSGSGGKGLEMARAAGLVGTERGAGGFGSTGSGV